MEGEVVKGDANGGQKEKGLLVPPTIKAVQYAEEPPTPGEHDAVLVDWYYDGYVTPDGTLIRTHVWFAFQIAQRKKANARRMWVRRKFANTFSRNANLRQFIEQWLGRPFDERTAQDSGFDPETFVDLPCHLTLAVVPWRPGQPFVKITAVRPWDWKAQRYPLQPEDVRRAKDHLAPWLKSAR